MAIWPDGGSKSPPSAHCSTPSPTSCSSPPPSSPWCRVNVLPGWMAILIIGREFAVSGLRQIAAAEGYTIKASDLGKTKMASQVVAVSCLLLAVRHPALRRPGMALMWIVVVFAMLSAISYFRKFWRKVDERTKLGRRRELLALERKRQRMEMRQRRSKGSGQLGHGDDLEARQK